MIHCVLCSCRVVHAHLVQKGNSLSMLCAAKMAAEDHCAHIVRCDLGCGRSTLVTPWPTVVGPSKTLIEDSFTGAENRRAYRRHKPKGLHCTPITGRAYRRHKPKELYRCSEPKGLPAPQAEEDPLLQAAKGSARAKAGASGDAAERLTETIMISFNQPHRPGEGRELSPNKLTPLTLFYPIDIILKNLVILDSALAQMPISSPVPSLIFLTLCCTLSNVADILRARMREEALLLVPPFARAADFVAGQRRRHRVVACHLRPCFRDTILKLARLHK